MTTEGNDFWLPLASNIQLWLETNKLTFCSDHNRPTLLQNIQKCLRYTRRVVFSKHVTHWSAVRLFVLYPITPPNWKNIPYPLPGTRWIALWVEPWNRSQVPRDWIGSVLKTILIPWTLKQMIPSNYIYKMYLTRQLEEVLPRFSYL
jgi:hypothetical protein